MTSRVLITNCGGGTKPMKQSCFQFRFSLPRNPRRERSHVRAAFNFAAMTLEKASDGKRKLRITRKSTYTQIARNLTLSESVREMNARRGVPVHYRENTAKSNLQSTALDNHGERN